MYHISEGGGPRKFCTAKGMHWLDMVSILKRTPTLFQLYLEAKAFGQTYKHDVAIEEADRRAIDGVDPKDKQKYSDKLLETQLKSRDKDGNYIEKKSVQTVGVTLQYNIQGIDREPLITPVTDSPE
jgi:hypothetical protein